MIEILFEPALPPLLLPLACLLILFLHLVSITVHIREALIFRQVIIILCTGSFIVESFIGQFEVVIEYVQVGVLLKEHLQLGVRVLDLLVSRLLCHAQRLVQVRHMIIAAHWVRD